MATLSSKARPLGVATSAQGVLADTAMQPVGIDDNATSTAITIDASQNVGIGAASPATMLHLLGDSASKTVGLFLQDSNGSGRNYLMKSAAGTLTFRDSTAAVDRMTIDSAGTVEIPGYVAAGTLSGTIMATSRVLGGYGTGNSASFAATSTSEARAYIVCGSRHTNSTNVTNIMAHVTYASASRTIVTINAGTSLSVTESAGVISVNNTGTAASVYMTVTRVY
mgnify:CR=1 FL=1